MTTKAVVLAGGRGTRLAPYTSVLPKPLLPVGDRAILELVVEQLAACSIREIILCVGHLSHLIRAVLENGKRNGPRVRFVQEETALGTAGPLRLVDKLDETFIVVNGDVLTTLDYSDVLRHHAEAKNTLTIAAQARTVKIEYGVIHHAPRESSVVSMYEEKPQLALTVSMGVYVMEPEVLEHIPRATYFDFPDLVNEMLSAGSRIGTYLYDGLWFDIGLRDEYERAVEVWAELEASGRLPLR